MRAPDARTPANTRTQLQKRSTPLLLLSTQQLSADSRFMPPEVLFRNRADVCTDFRVSLSRERVNMQVCYYFPPWVSLPGFYTHGANIQRDVGWIRDSTSDPWFFINNILCSVAVPKKRWRRAGWVVLGSPGSARCPRQGRRRPVGQ